MQMLVSLTDTFRLTLLAGANLEVGSGYTLSSYAVSSGITEKVLSGGTASHATISSGGTLTLYASAYSGNLSGFGADTTQYIDLTDISSAGATFTRPTRRAPPAAACWKSSMAARRRPSI